MFQTDESDRVPVTVNTADLTIDRDLLNVVKSEAKAFFDEARGSHDWEHTERVCRLCERIGSAEGADMDVLLSAAYLHDIARGRQDRSNGAVCHAEAGARLAEPVVADLPLSNARKENILHCIQAHRFRGQSIPRTLEARVLFDADKLDAIGAVGVARAFLFAGEVGARLHNSDIDIENSKPYSREDTGYREYKVKLCKVQDRMLTGTGQKLAEERHQFMEQFFQRLQDEHEGKR